MKRFLAGLVVGIVIASVPVAFAEDVIHLVVNGQEIVFPDAPPQMINGRVMVPARPLAEALGAKVEWDEANQAVIVTKPEPVAQTPAPPPQPPVFYEQDGKVWVYTWPLREVIYSRFPGHSVGLSESGVDLDRKPFVRCDSIMHPVTQVMYTDFDCLVTAGVLKPEDRTNH